MTVHNIHQVCVEVQSPEAPRLFRVDLQAAKLSVIYVVTVYGAAIYVVTDHHICCDHIHDRARYTPGLCEGAVTRGAAAVPGRPP